jgi:hypothetical protein
MRELLDTESQIATEARAALEESHMRIEEERKEAAIALQRIRRELDASEERARRLALQLKAGAASASEGRGAVLRASKTGVGAKAPLQVGSTASVQACIVCMHWQLPTKPCQLLLYG